MASVRKFLASSHDNEAQLWVVFSDSNSRIENLEVKSSDTLKVHVVMRTLDSQAEILRAQRDAGDQEINITGRRRDMIQENGEWVMPFPVEFGAGE